MAGFLRDGKKKAALIALVLGLLTLSLAPTAAQRPAGRTSAGHTGLRPSRVRLPAATPAPSPAAVDAAPIPTMEQPAPAPSAEQPVPAPAPPEPAIQAPLPAPIETIAIAAVSPPPETPPPTVSAEPTPSPTPPAESPAPPPAPTTAEGLDAAFAEAIVALTNETRLASGLAPLAENPALVAAAEEYADLHAHASPRRLDHGLNGTTLQSRAEAEGYDGWTFLAENLVWSSFNPSLSPAETVQEWLASPGHRDNILNPTVNEIGVGCYVSAAEEPFRICVQDFGARP